MASWCGGGGGRHQVLVPRPGLALNDECAAGSVAVLNTMLLVTVSCCGVFGFAASDPWGSKDRGVSEGGTRSWGSAAPDLR